MRNGLYPRLAAQNLRQNRRFFLPYLLALVGLSAAFYVMAALVFDPGAGQLRGAEYVQVMMGLGMGVAGLFSTVLLLYSNSFLMKQRKRELGLYNILGMEKRHIAHILFRETLLLAACSLALGLGLGIVFSRVLFGCWGCCWARIWPWPLLSLRLPSPPPWGCSGPFSF